MMREKEEDYLVYLFLLNTFSILMEGLAELSVLTFFLTILIPTGSDGVPTGAPAEIVRTPVVSLPVRSILSTPFFRRFSVIYYPNLYRSWASLPLIPLGHSLHK